MARHQGGIRMQPYRLTQEHQEKFQQDGCFVVPELFGSTETQLLQAITSAVLPDDPHRLDRHDSQGNKTLLSLRNELCDDIFSATVRCERIVQTISTLLEDEVYHYHHKVMIKEPKVGGAWEWHQDYGYWYDNGCLWPDMASCLIAITEAKASNGCLQVVSGTHRMGRIDHVLVDDQVCADPDRVAQILEREAVQHVELPSGAGLFFHANLLHRSDRNLSEEPRLSLINCYNTRTNNPYKDHHHPRYTPLEVLSDTQVVTVGQQQLRALDLERENP